MNKEVLHEVQARLSLKGKLDGGLNALVRDTNAAAKIVENKERKEKIRLERLKVVIKNRARLEEDKKAKNEDDEVEEDPELDIDKDFELNGSDKAHVMVKEAPIWHDGSRPDL